MNRMLLGALLLLGTAAFAEPGDDLGPWKWESLPDYIAFNSNEIVYLFGNDIRSTVRGIITHTAAIEANLRVNEAGDFTHAQWVGPGVRGGFLNGEHYVTPATFISISDDGEVVWFNPTAGQLHSNERGLLANLGYYVMQSGLDVNNAGQYTWGTGGYPIYNIWHSSLGVIGQGWNPRINNLGNVCWTGLVLGRKWPICDGEPVDFDMGRPPVPQARMYTPERADFFDVTDTEILVQKVWRSPLASTHTGGDTILHHVVRIPLTQN